MTRSIFDSPRNVAARMGNWSATHRKTAIFGWLAFVVAPFGAVQHLRSPLTAADEGQISPDRHTALVEWDMAGPVEKAEKHIDPLTSTVAIAARANPDFYIGEAGSVSSEKALNKLFNEQLGQAGERSVPLTLLILVLVFGSLLAAFVPLMLGLQAVIATIGLTAIFSHVVPMDE